MGSAWTDHAGNGVRGRSCLRDRESGVAMSEADETVGATNGPDQDTPDEGARTENRIDIGGNTVGPVVAGNHNLVIDAQHGSAVTLLMEHERPRPVRRDRVELLPRRQRTPVGREPELAALAEAVRAGGLVQLWGPSGVGKSAVLRHAAHTLEPGSGGVVYLNAAYREAEDLAQEVFEACYQTAGYAPSAAELRRLMTGVQVTVYVDNADLTSEQMLTLTDAAPDATFVFASHDRSLWGGDGTALELKGLDRTAGLALLSEELYRPLTGSELAAATSLWEAAEGRPLLLLRAAGLARFDAEGARWPRPGEVSALLPLLLDQLDEAATNVLHLLATMDGAEMDPVHIGAITDVPDTARVCRRLADLGLVRAEEHGYRCSPDSVPAMMERRPDPFPVDQICRYFTRWATQPTTTQPEIARYSLALEKAAALAEAADRPDLAVRLARAASPAMAGSLRFGAWARMLGRGWVAARRTGDKQAEAYFTHEEGIRSLLTGRRVVAAVLLGEALVLWRKLGDTHATNAAVHAQQYVPSAASPPTASVVHSGSSAATHSAGAAHSTTAQTASAHMSNLAQSPTGLGAATQAPPVAHTGATAAAAGGTHGGAATTSAASGVTAAPSGAAGGAHSGAAATAAGAASGTSAMSGFLATLAIVGAIVAGGVVIDQLDATSSDTSVVDTGPTDTPGSGLVAPPGNATPDDGEPTTPPNTDLAGVWETSPGKGVRVVSTGSGSYTVDGGDEGCQPLNFDVSGSDGSYSGTQTLYPDNGDPCAAPIGTVTVNIEVSPDGTTAEFVTEGENCITCGSETWTRSDQP